MIDTVTMMVEGQPNLEFFRSRLSNFEKIYNYRSGRVVFRGNLRNMHFKIYPHGIKINGSLHRYFMGDNLGVFTLDEAKTAFDQLTMESQLNTRDAQIWRFDMACNLKMNQPISTYLDLCERARPRGRYKRAEYSGKTVKFMNGHRTVQLYDKIAEMKNRKQPIPEDLKNANILRCEVQYKRRVSKQFNTPVSPGILCDNTFYSHVIDRWETEFLNIRFRRQHRLFREVRVKEFMDHLALHGLDYTGGEQSALDMLLDAKKNGLINSVQHSRFKARLNRLIRQQGLTEPFSASEELKTKIKLAADYQRLFLN